MRLVDARHVATIVLLSALAVAPVASWADMGPFPGARTLRQPPDRFIDLLRDRIERGHVYSYATVSRTGHAIDAIALTKYTAEEIVELYQHACREAELHCEVRRGGALGTVFDADIDGAHKRLMLTSSPAGTLVQIHSGQNDFRFIHEHPSILARYPELGRIGERVIGQNETHHSIGNSGWFAIRTAEDPRAALARARHELAAAGWESHPGGAGPLGVMRKGAATLMIQAGANRGHSALLLYVTGALAD